MNQYLTRDVITVAHQFHLYRDAFSMELMSMEEFQGEEFLVAEGDGASATLNSSQQPAFLKLSRNFPHQSMNCAAQHRA